MRKQTVVYSVACVFVAASLATWGHAAPRPLKNPEAAANPCGCGELGQSVAPNDDLKCQPAIVDNSATGKFLSKVWITNQPPTGPLGSTAWWSLKFQMQYQFDCGGGNDNSNCKICRYTEVDYFSNRNNVWVQAVGGFIGYSTDSGNCQARTTVTVTTTYSYPYPAGTTLDVTWYAAPYDPAIGACNNGEDYQCSVSAQVAQGLG